MIKHLLPTSSVKKNILYGEVLGNVNMFALWVLIISISWTGSGWSGRFEHIHSFTNVETTTILIQTYATRRSKGVYGCVFLFSRRKFSRMIFKQKQRLLIFAYHLAKQLIF